MATEEEASQKIYDLAGNCEDLFGRLLSVLSRTSDKHFRIVQEHHQRFERWAGYLGVFAAPQASLDSRLRSDADIHDLVIQLLKILQRNIQHGLKSESTRSQHAEDDGSITNTQASEEVEATLPLGSSVTQAALDGIHEAIDRLHRIGSAIRKISTSSLASRVKKFARKADDDHTFFERIALLIVKGLYPNIRDSFAKQLARSVSFRRQRFLYQKKHQNKLKTRRPPQMEPKRPVEPTRHAETPQPASKIANGEHQTQRQAREVRSSSPSKIDASTVTLPSAFDSRKFRLDVTENVEAVSGPPTVTSIANNNPYPRPPKLKDGEKHCQCDWCFRELQVPDEKAQWKHVWRSHFKEDLEPYVCISEECSEQPVYFVSLRSWRKHMDDFHTTEWTQEIHKPTVWYCDLEQHDYEEFADARELHEHLQQTHEDRFTPDQRDTMVMRNVLSIYRDSNICPLCEQDISTPDREQVSTMSSSNDRKSPKPIPLNQPARKPRVQVPEDHVNSDEEDSFAGSDAGLSGSENVYLAIAEESQVRVNHIKLATHVAGHLKSLAFTSLRYFDDESASVESQKAALGAGGEESSRQERWSDHYLDLEGSLTFEDVPPHQRILTNDADTNAAKADAQASLDTLDAALSGTQSELGEEDLEEALLTARRAVDVTPEDHPDMAGRLNHLGHQLGRRFERTGRIENLEEAIRTARRAVEITPDDHSDLPGRLNNLGHQLGRRFKRTGRIEDLEEAIRTARRAVEITPDDHSDLSERLNNLSHQLGRRFERTGRIEDLEEAIRIARRAVEVTSDGHPDLPGRLNNLGHQLGRRFKRTGRIEDLEEAIRIARRAVIVIQDDHPDLAGCLNNLGAKLESRFERMGKIEDLEEAIRTARRAVDATPEDHPDLAGRLNNLSSMLGRQFERTGRIENLEEALLTACRAVDVTPDDDSDLPETLNNLGHQRGRRFKRTGRIEDLEEAIRITRRAVEITPDDHSDLPKRLNNLGHQLGRRFERMGRIEDLERAIQIARRAVVVIQDDHPDLAGCLNNLGAKLESRFERMGKIEDLEEAIRTARRAVNATPEDHPDLAGRLNNLGSMLGRQFERTGQMENLEEAIRTARRAVDATPEDHPDLIGRLNNLGSMFNRRFERTGQMENLEEAIRIARRAVVDTPDDHPDLAGYLNNLGAKLENRFERMGKIEDLEEAIRTARRAVDATPDDHPDLAGRLNNLGSVFGRQFEITGRMEDLEEATRTARRAVEITPDDHPDLAGRLNNLGNKLSLSSDLSDHEQAFQSFLKAWNCNNAIPFHRLAAALLTIRILKSRNEWSEACNIAIDATRLLPLVKNRSLRREDQQHMVSRFSGLAADVCALMLQTGYHAFEALELLEFCRGVIMGLLLDDRSDISALRSSHPEKAAVYERLRSEVNMPIQKIEDEHYRQRQLNRHLEAVKELDERIHEIRQLPQYQRFLLGPTPEELKSWASEGPIVIVNITDIRSDAILVTNSSIESIELQELTITETTKWIEEDLTVTMKSRTPRNRGRTNKQYREFLQWLWDKCVKVILHKIYEGQKPTPETLKRIWWMGIGMATSFPFHAAGDHSVDSTEQTTFGWAISSYTPTMKILNHARVRESMRQYNARQPKLLIVAMPASVGQANLPGITREISEIETAVSSVFSSNTLIHPDAKTVLDQLNRCDAVHFACHGTSDYIDPFNSSLILQKNTSTGPITDKLTVRQIVDAELETATIAYLSGGSIAENRASIMQDEVVHLASGFQVAGFSHVIATMWPPTDNDCVEMAKGFYTRLRQIQVGPPSRRGIAEAVHRSTLEIRSRLRATPLNWAPYIHVGV